MALSCRYRCFLLGTGSHWFCFFSPHNKGHLRQESLASLPSTRMNYGTLSRPHRSLACRSPPVEYTFQLGRRIDLSRHRMPPAVAVYLLVYRTGGIDYEHVAKLLSSILSQLARLSEASLRKRDVFVGSDRVSRTKPLSC